MSQKVFKKHYYNNGIIQRKFFDGEEPEGFVKGQLPRSKEHSLKIVESRKQNNSYQAWNKGKTITRNKEDIELSNQKRIATRLKNGTKPGRQKGSTAWNKDLKNPYPEGINQKISTTLKEGYKSGKIISKALGKKATSETIQKLHDSHVGKTIPEEKLKDINKKKYDTMKNRHTFRTSKPEENYYKLLINLFGEEDVVREYVDIRYPFKCDFYVKSKDLFIELNIYGTHGKHPFNPNCNEDIIEAQRLKDKPQTRISSKGYEVQSWYAIKLYVWTEYDVLKRQTALKNNLNYLCYYSENEAKDDIFNL